MVKKQNPDWVRSQQPLQKWYASSLGQSILVEMNTTLSQFLPDVFGFQGVQIGQLSQNSNLLESAGLHRKFILSGTTTFSGVDIGADAMHLPIASDTMNLAILPHSLDFCNNPHQVLRESDRILTKDGHLLIIGFNPYSLVGLKRAAMFWRGRVPWNGGFYSRGRIADWLSLLNFRILREESFFLRLPVSRTDLLRRTRFVEKARPMFGKLGGIYIVHARKQTIPMTAVRNKWRRQSASVAVGSLVQRINQRTVRRQVPLKSPVKLYNQNED